MRLSSELSSIAPVGILRLVAARVTGYIMAKQTIRSEPLWMQFVEGRHRKRKWQHHPDPWERDTKIVRGLCGWKIYSVWACAPRVFMEIAERLSQVCTFFAIRRPQRSIRRAEATAAWVQSARVSTN